MAAVKPNQSKHRVIACDLDGTLAFYDHWRGPEIGAPIPEMIAKVKQALAQGDEVWIFTARVSCGDHSLERGLSATQSFLNIAAWCKHYLGQLLPITYEKSFRFTDLWDDKAEKVLLNTGIFATELLDAANR